jgi:DNA-binding NarL/FixJ family response regulator
MTMYLDHDMITSIAERWVAAYNARDLDAMVELAHTDVDVVPSTSFVALPGTTYHGHTGLRALTKSGWEKFPNLEVQLVDTREVDDWLVATTTFAMDAAAAPDVKHEAAYLMSFEHGLIRELQTFAADSEAVAAAKGGVLTPRERQVFQLLANGLSAPEVADELFLSPATVRTHVQNAIARSGARTRVQAIALAVARGEIKL